MKKMCEYCKRETEHSVAHNDFMENEVFTCFECGKVSAKHIGYPSLGFINGR